MSIQTSVSARLRNGAAQGALEVLRALLSGGWRMERSGEIVFLRKGDEDYDWYAEPDVSKEKVLSEMSEKAAAGEPLGIVLAWHGTDAAVDATIRADMIEISPTVNRRLLESGVTDVSWYIERLAPALRSLGVVEWKWEELGW